MLKRGGDTGLGRQGFTIVELLIVVVVIAILAAITIVAYNGVTDRTRASSAQSSTASAVKSLEVFKVTNERYPTSDTEAKLPSNGTTATYVAYNAGAGYCVSYVSGQVSYYATNTVQPREGNCSPVTNLATNPSLEGGANTGWGAQWFGAGGGAGTNAINGSGALCGSLGWRKTWTTAGGFQDIGFNYAVPATITANTEYSFSVASRASFPTTYRAWASWRNSSGTVLSSSNMGTYYEVPIAGETKVKTFKATAPAGATSVYVIWGPYPVQAGQPGYNVTIPVGATLDGDCVFVAETGRSVNYADGYSTNWSWSGVPNASTSSGPAY